MALGFIEETRHGNFSKKNNIASEWGLTAFYCDLTKSPKTCAFMHREAQARDLHQPRSRASMEPLPCPHCGELFKPLHARKYCSESCRKIAENDRLRGSERSYSAVASVLKQVQFGPIKNAVNPLTVLTRLSQLGQAGGEFWGWEGAKSESVQRCGFEIRL